MNRRFQFNRMELAGSLGDFGTILPLALGMILMNGLDPLSLLFCVGIYYIFSGSQLALTLLDMKTRKELFVPMMVLGITLASNLAVGFLTGIALAYALKSERLTI